MNTINTTNPSKKMERKDKLIIIDWLIEHFSSAFFKQARSIKPLRIGIFEEINDFYNRLDTPTFSKKALREALSYYCTSPAYLSCQKVDAARVDLFGNEVELVTPEQAQYAQQRYERQYMSPRKKNTFIDC
ncbi:MAG: ProQ/FinO family protein [Legionellaceae bacterium]|nr:ProQ/FinO family protein [Legionellaceae bacterium]